MSFSLKKNISFIRKGTVGIVFPNVCICCGLEVTQKEKQICSFCLSERFEDANPQNGLNSSHTILPEGVFAQHALWKFDKGGALQQLLHRLKYERLTRIGFQLGEQLGERIKKHPGISSLLIRKDVILVPVPLHYLKFMRRGFNQAYIIAKGIKSIFNFTICDIKSVTRRKNTRSQTGFNLAKRIENMKDAFVIKDEVSLFENKLVVIVDDVFTTGTTSFELSKVLLNAGADGVVILTVAQA